MRLIMDLIGQELFELFPLEFAKIAESDFVYSIASTKLCRPISAKHVHSIYDDEFDYGSNLTVTSGVICP